MIYLFNQTEKLIDVIDEASLADFTHTIELNRFDRASFEIPVDYKPEIIKEAQFFGFQSRDRAFVQDFRKILRYRFDYPRDRQSRKRLAFIYH